MLFSDFGDEIGGFMENHNLYENMEIIKKAYSVLENDYALHKCTIRMQMSFISGLCTEDVDYNKLDYKLKAIRQDFAKILVIMNSIDKTYSAYQKDEYIPSYFSIMKDQATAELGCFIEYLFAKYRVILEYVQQILEICIPPKLSSTIRNEYNQLTKYYKKYNFLLKFIAENFGKRSNLLNMEWFQQLRVERDLIIHDGATCLVFGDKENLLFKVMTTDALEKENENEQDAFYSNDRGLIYYSYYCLYTEGFRGRKRPLFPRQIYQIVNFQICIAFVRTIGYNNSGGVYSE